MSVSRENVKVVKRYSEALKQKIVEEVEGGVLTVREAMDSYGIEHRKTINRWVHKLGRGKYQTQVVRVMMASEKDRIRELEKALADEKLRTQVAQAELEYYREQVPDLKKRLSTKELKKFEEIERRNKQYR